MKRLIIILVLLPANLIGQNPSETTKIFGFTISADQALNLPDKALKFGLAGKLSLGVSFTNKRRQFVLFAGGGIKGAKFTIHSARFNKSFLGGIQENYTEINGYSLDSLIADKMINSPGRDFRGTYSQHLKLGIMLNLKFRPILQIYYGNEQLLLRDDTFLPFTDSEYGDVNYVALRTRFYEIKAGISLPIRNSNDNNFSFVVNLGYKGVNYGDFKFADTSLSQYTNQSFADQFRKSGKLTLSVGFIFWTNWS